MKKLLSMVLALTMVFSSFAAIVKADSLPTVTVKTTKITDATEISTVTAALLAAGEIEAADEVEDYSLYKIEAFIQGLALSREDKSKMNGTLLTGFELAANGNMAKFGYAYVDKTNYPYMTLSTGATGISLGWDPNGYNNTKSFPARNTTLDTTVPTLFYTAYVFVEDDTTFTVADSSLTTDVYSAGYSTGAATPYDTINAPATIEFAETSAPPTPTYTESEITIDTPVSGTTGLTDLQGREVALTKNYGIAKFSSSIDTSAKDYFLAVEAGEEKTEFAIDFGAKGVEIGGGAATFFAIVRSATRVITSIKLKEVAKSE